MKDVIIPIITALIGALITAVVSLYIQKRKEKREDNDKKSKARREIFENRPEFKVVDYKNYLNRIGYGIKQATDVDAFVTSIVDIKLCGRVDAIYKKEHFNSKEWCCVIYTFKNVGKTDVIITHFVCHHKRTKVLFNTSTAQAFLNSKCLNYDTSFDKKIRVGESFTFKLCYHKDAIYESFMDAFISINMKDSNKNCWSQPLFAPFDKIYESYPITYQEYRNDISIEDAEECFQKPWLW